MLLPFSYFDPIFLPLQNKKIHFVEGTGNVGDDLINEATYQLFEIYKINLVSFEESEIVILGGGGNFGSKFASQRRQTLYEKVRQASLRKEVIIFPQSVYSTYNSIIEEVPDFVSKFYVRDRKSHEIMPQSILVPDLVLGYTYKGMIQPPTKKEGYFLREDIEAVFGKNYQHDGDPVAIVPRSTEAYFQLAMQYEHIYTDRLHFAISGLILGRKVTLLPNGYFKNRMLWETWLRDVGCLWADEPPLKKRFLISIPPILFFAFSKIVKGDLRFLRKFKS